VIPPVTPTPPTPGAIVVLLDNSADEEEVDSPLVGVVSVVEFMFMLIDNGDKILKIWSSA
jgi:hypothetical protein